MAGSPSRVEVIPRRCPIPRENPPALWSATLVSPTRSRTSSTRREPIPLARARPRRWLRALRPGMERLVHLGADGEQGLVLMGEWPPVGHRGSGCGFVEA